MLLTGSLGNDSVKRVKPRAIDSGRLVLDEPVPRCVKRVEEDGAPTSHPDLEDWPAILLCPRLCRGRVVASELVEMSRQDIAARYFWNAIDLGIIDVEEFQYQKQDSSR